MDTRSLFVKYLHRFVQQWGAIALLVVDLIVFALGLFTDLSLPQWMYWAVLVVSVFWASFRIYAEQEREKEKQRRDCEDRLNTLDLRLQEIEDYRPRPELYFQTDQGFVEHLLLTIPPYPEPPNMEEEIKKARSELTYKPPKATLAEFGRLLSRPTPEQLEKYNQQVEHYIAGLREYLKYTHRYSYLACRIRAIQLVVDNTGKRPAQDVVLFAHFPDDIRIIPKDELPPRPEPPSKPRLPRGVFSALKDLSAGIYLPRSDIQHYLEDFPSIGGRVSGPHITKGHSTQVSYEIKTVMHNVPETELDPFFIIVPEERVNRVFDIPYEIHVSELPDPTKRTLIIEVRYET